MAQRFGSGEHVYELVPDWGKLPAGWSLRDACDVAVDSRDRVFVFNRGGHPIVIFDRDGAFLGSWGENVFGTPHGLHIGPDDSVYCIDSGDHTVRKFTPDGKLLLTLGTPGQPSATGDTSSLDTITGGPPFNRPSNAAVAPDGDLYVTDGYGNCRVHRFAPDGTLRAAWGAAGRGPGQFRLVHGICFGPDGTVYVGDRANDRIQHFSPTGEYLNEWSDVRQPDNVQLGPDGNFYVAELGHQGDRVKTDGLGSRITIRDAAGTILSAWGDEGDPTAPGNCAAAHGIALDSEQSLYLGEVTYTARIRNGQVPADCHVLQKWVRVR